MLSEGAAARYLGVDLRTLRGLSGGKVMHVRKVRAGDPTLYYRGELDRYLLVSEAHDARRSAEYSVT
ncbi:MAG TPA: hypothetical protein VF736_00030 [Pyrinomonadaceae bacterium]|jgi:hypothetical protein